METVSITITITFLVCLGALWWVDYEALAEHDLLKWQGFAIFWKAWFIIFITLVAIGYLFATSTSRIISGQFFSIAVVGSLLCTFVLAIGISLLHMVDRLIAKAEALTEDNTSSSQDDTNLSDCPPIPVLKHEEKTVSLESEAKGDELVSRIVSIETSLQSDVSSPPKGLRIALGGILVLVIVDAIRKLKQKKVERKLRWR